MESKMGKGLNKGNEDTKIVCKRALKIKEREELHKAEMRKHPYELTSVYQAEFHPKYIKRTKPYKPIVEIFEGNLLSNPFFNKLKANCELLDLDDRKDYDAGLCYFKRLKERKPSITKIVEKEVNQKYLTEEYMNSGRSVYQVDYCKPIDPKLSEDPGFSKESLQLKPVTIPPQWLPVPLTTYASAFKNHHGVAPWNLKPVKFIPPVGELTPSSKDKELYDPTGVSEYMAEIGYIGGRVIMDEYHGKVKTLPFEYIPPNASSPQRLSE